ncbi:MAG: hypothetical protein IKJ01_00860 [Lachnospiraceae bacterium]|nr:hypothetical protein [Lachnospiraceae bacterium]
MKKSMWKKIIVGICCICMLLATGVTNNTQELEPCGNVSTDCQEKN